MKKNNLEKKEYRKFIISERLKGKSDQEIYFDLRKDSGEKDEIAKLICSIASPDKVKEFKVLRSFIIILLLVSIPGFFYFVRQSATDPYWGEMFFSSIFLTSSGYCIYHLHIGYHYEGIQASGILPIYIAIVVGNQDNEILFYLWMSWILLTVILSFYVTFRMFPRIKIFKERSKDVNGEYLFQ